MDATEKDLAQDRRIAELYRHIADLQDGVENVSHRVFKLEAAAVSPPTNCAPLPQPSLLDLIIGLFRR